MTPVEEIRRAAALMRERAQKATSGPWSEPYHEYAPRGDEGWWIHNGLEGASKHAVAVVVDYNPQASADAEHIASWHPAVAVAVADWLDHTALLINSNALASSRGANTRALAVARAYLAGKPLDPTLVDLDAEAEHTERIVRATPPTENVPRPGMTRTGAWDPTC